MSIDKETELSQSILLHGIDILEKLQADPNDVKKYVEKLFEEKLNYPVPLENIDTDNWFMPDQYKNLDIEEFLVTQCPEENYDRLITELQEYRQRNLIPLLQQMKYIVDTLRKNNIVWGVGRGSSVASYVLFLLGVHKVDSVKYDIPINEFFKGEKNG